MAFPLRFEIFARRFLSPHLLGSEETGPGDMLRFLLQPSAPARGASYITRREETDSWIKAYLQGHSAPIYWPKEDPFSTMEVIVGEQFYPGDWHRYFIPETSIHPGDVVVDCGAAEGLFTFLAAPTAGKVHAIEPLPRFQEAMRLTFANNPNVEIVPVALGAEEGEANLVCLSVCSNLEDVGNEVGVDTVRVKVVPLDKLFADRTIDFFKADIEGFELNVLQGAKELIHRSKPRIAVTTYHKPEHAAEITRILRSIHPGYRIKYKGASIHGTPLMLHAWI